MAASGIAVPDKNCWQTAYDSLPTFWVPQNSKFPIQHGQQGPRRPSWIDYFKSTALPSCRQGGSCRLVVWSSHVGSMHMQSEDEGCSCFCSNRQSDPSGLHQTADSASPDLRYRGFLSHRSDWLRCLVPPVPPGLQTSGDQDMTDFLPRVLEDRWMG